MDLTIVIPAYNEEKRIGRTLRKIISFFEKQVFKPKIIVVDDGSTDKTVQIVHDIDPSITVIQNKVNSGKGFSVKRGIKNAKTKLVLFTDADLATPIVEIMKMGEELKKGVDIVIASRNLPKSRIVVKQPLYRQIMGRTFPILVRIILQTRLKYTQCGFKLFKTTVAKKIIQKQTSNGFAFDVELLTIAKIQGFRVTEVPVKWIDQEGSKVDPIKDSYKMFLELLKFKINVLKKKYD